MKKNRKAVSKNEMMKGKWKRQIMLEKDYTEQCSFHQFECSVLFHISYGCMSILHIFYEGFQSFCHPFGTTKVDDLQNREFHGMESDRIGESFSDQLISNITT